MRAIPKFLEGPVLAAPALLPTGLEIQAVLPRNRRLPQTCFFGEALPALMDAEPEGALALAPPPSPAPVITAVACGPGVSPATITRRLDGPLLIPSTI